MRTSRNTLRWVWCIVLSVFAVWIEGGASALAQDDVECGAENGDYLDRFIGNSIILDCLNYNSCNPCADGPEPFDISNRAAGSVEVPIFFHVLAPSTKTIVAGQSNQATIDKLLNNLNSGFAGATSASAVDSSFRFKPAVSNYVLYSNDFRGLLGDCYSTSSTWMKMDQKDQEHEEIRQDCIDRVGFPGALHVFIGDVVDPSATKQPTGFATFPWEIFRVNGVVMDYTTLPGGSDNQYNKGDTLTHEVGHWMGLFHTFEVQKYEMNGKLVTPQTNGCHTNIKDPNFIGDYLLGDAVYDTAPEKTGHTRRCEEGRDTCGAATSVNDPIHNFMDVSTDTCRNRLSAGQVARMNCAMFCLRGY